MKTEKFGESGNWFSNLILSETLVGIFGVVLMFAMFFAFSAPPITTGAPMKPSVAESEWPELVIPDDRPDDAVQTASRGEQPGDLSLQPSTR